MEKLIGKGYKKYATKPTIPALKLWFFMFTVFAE